MNKRLEFTTVLEVLDKFIEHLASGETDRLQIASRITQEYNEDRQNEEN